MQYLALSAIRTIIVETYGSPFTMVSGFAYQYQSKCLKINNLKGFLNQSRGSLLRCSQQTRFLPLAYDLSNPLSNMSSREPFTTMSDLHPDNLSFVPVKNRSYYYFLLCAASHIARNFSHFYHRLYQFVMLSKRKIGCNQPLE